MLRKRERTCNPFSTTTIARVFQPRCYFQNYSNTNRSSPLSVSSAICRGRRLERHIRGVDSEASGHKGSSQGIVRRRRLEPRDSGEPVAALGRDHVHGRPRETGHPFGERTRTAAERTQGSSDQVHRAPWTASQIPVGQRRWRWILPDNCPRRRSPPPSDRPRRPTGRTTPSRIHHSGQR